MKPCPDCKGKLSPIQIIDQRGNSKVAVGFHYTRGEAPKTSAWSGNIQISAGTVQAAMAASDQAPVRYARQRSRRRSWQLSLASMASYEQKPLGLSPGNSGLLSCQPSTIHASKQEALPRAPF